MLTNAPPMHPRCRSTISAIISEGTRTARVKGKNIRVPADMTYHDYKKVYVDKSLSLKDWTAARENNQLQESSSGTIIKGAKPAQLTRISDIKDIEDANNFAMKVLGIPRASYAGCDVTVAKKWNERLQQVFQDFPELKKQIRFVGETHERNKLIEEEAMRVLKKSKSHDKPYLGEKIIENIAKLDVQKIMGALTISAGDRASSLADDNVILRDFNGITLNADYAKSAVILLAGLKDSVRRKWHPVGCDTIERLVDHEIGHQLCKLLDLSSNKEIQNLYESLVIRKGKIDDYSQMTEKLSEYAWNNKNKNRYSEFIAEAWAEYYKNPNPREIARKVGEIIEREYTKSFSKGERSD